MRGTAGCKEEVSPRRPQIKQTCLSSSALKKVTFQNLPFAETWVFHAGGCNSPWEWEGRGTYQELRYQKQRQPNRCKMSERLQREERRVDGLWCARLLCYFMESLLRRATTRQWCHAGTRCSLQLRTGEWQSRRGTGKEGSERRSGAALEVHVRSTWWGMHGRMWASLHTCGDPFHCLKWGVL